MRGNEVEAKSAEVNRVVVVGQFSLSIISSLW
jgi:hypothetical protein